jgi:hypothetical protein
MGIPSLAVPALSGRPDANVHGVVNFAFWGFSEVHLLLETKVPKIRSLRDMRSPSEE